MFFLSFFKSEMPNILLKLKSIRKDLDETKNSLARLIALETQINRIDIETIIDNFSIALWAKDLAGRFLFVNKACCRDILKCSMSQALNMTNGDFKKDALSQVCIQSDQLVMKSLLTRRFIEYAKYSDGDIYLDVLKSPLYKEDKLVGITGNAINITKSIPERIREQTRSPNSIEIPVNTTMSKQMFIEFLERRKIERQK